MRSLRIRPVATKQFSAISPNDPEIPGEATGIYHLELCLALHAAKGVKVMVINPRVAKDFSKAMM